ncbi:MAG: Dam family site-specific DNA-(adenine-N6)-methyltransferase, partial [Pyrinomonadaceae bacterium]|nr:Dam family site-specific DNA-(adenine-N6)-methyltransferase [Pyrinomonadaceae bacterium]
MARPFVKWAGGKTQLLKEYEAYIPSDVRVYHEPFLGGGAMFFNLCPPVAHLSDINGGLINAYKIVRDNPTELINRLTVHKLKHCSNYYLEQRALEAGDDVERAARFIYLNKTCFNGLYRENLKGKFNVPMGAYSNPIVCDVAAIVEASKALQGIS